MRKKKFRLRGSESFREDDKKLISNLMNQIRERDNPSGSEALFLDQFVLLPNGTNIKDPSNLVIDPVKQQDVKQRKKARQRDYISELPAKELRDSLNKNKKQFNLGQQELRNIVSSFSKKTDDAPKNEEHEVAQLEEITVNVYVKSYINKIHIYCDKLIDRLYLKDPNVLQPNDKEDVLHKLDLLQSHLDNFRKDLYL